jgi:hypothetical protein
METFFMIIGYILTAIPWIIMIIAPVGLVYIVVASIIDAIRGKSNGRLPAPLNRLIH